MSLSNKFILVTGADGFIGSHLVEQLLKDGHRVRAFVFYNSFGTWGWLDSLDREILSRLEIVQGDIRDSSQVRAALQGIDCVFHLAALIAIPFSYLAPSSYVETNINGTLNILQAAKDLKTERVIITSTSEVYGTAKFVPITEEHPKQPQSPYSATKISADAMADSFYRCFNVPVTIVRPFNTYGPRQSNRAIIPTIITQILSGKTEISLGDLRPTRDLVYVLDTVLGFIEIAKCQNLVGHEVNIATNSEIAVGELALKISSLMKTEVSILEDKVRLRPEASEVNRLMGSNVKLLENTSWRQRYSLEHGLEETISWFSSSDNLSKYKTDIYGI